MSADFSTALGGFVFAMQPEAPDFRELQNQRMRALLQHAVTHVPLYRELYARHGIDVRRIETVDDLWRLPAISKSDLVRVGPEGYVDERKLPVDHLYGLNTSGSVGAALTMYSAQDEAQFQLAALWSMWIGLGVRPGDRLFMMTVRFLAEKIESFATAFVPREMPMDEMVEQFVRFRPTVIIGMTESVALLAAELGRRNISERHDVRLLFVFGQTYSEQMRRMVRRGFDTDPFVLYGSTETGWMAYECERHNGLHLMPHRNVLQIARIRKPDEPVPEGENGEIIVTSLLRRTSPIIRYRLHDIAALDQAPCPCGRRFPRLTKLEGREQDFLVSQNGRWIAPSALMVDLINERPDLLDYRIVQPTPEQVQVSLVFAREFDKADRKQIEQLVRRYLGEVKVDIDLVDEIPRDASGKRRRIFRMFDLPE